METGSKLASELLPVPESLQMEAKHGRLPPNDKQDGRSRGVWAAPICFPILTLTHPHLPRLAHNRRHPKPCMYHHLDRTPGLSLLALPTWLQLAPCPIPVLMGLVHALCASPVALGPAVAWTSTSSHDQSPSLSRSQLNAPAKSTTARAKVRAAHVSHHGLGICKLETESLTWFHIERHLAVLAVTKPRKSSRPLTT